MWLPMRIIMRRVNAVTFRRNQYIDNRNTLKLRGKALR